MPPLENNPGCFYAPNGSAEHDTLSQDQDLTRWSIESESGIANAYTLFVSDEVNYINAGFSFLGIIDFPSDETVQFRSKLGKFSVSNKGF